MSLEYPYNELIQEGEVEFLTIDGALTFIRYCVTVKDIAVEVYRNGRKFTVSMRY